MAYGGTPTTETVNLDGAPVAGARPLSSIERVFGSPIRLFVFNVFNDGPNIWSSFHVVGANPANKTVGQQSVTVGPGDGACVELTLTEPGIYPAVNHAFGHAQHGAIALFQAA